MVQCIFFSSAVEFDFRQDMECTKNVQRTYSLSKTTWITWTANISGLLNNSSYFFRTNWKL